MQQYIEELLSRTRESILKESLMDYIIIQREWTKPLEVEIEEKEIHYIY